MRAVRFDRYGGDEVLEVLEVEDPVAGPGRVVVRVRAAALNPGEIAIREGKLHDRWPATFPSGQGTDLAGVVEQAGDGVTAFSAGDEVLGWTEERASQAELVSVPVEQLIPKPAALSWEAAGTMFVAPMAGYALIQAAAPQPGETIVVSGAAGGTGSIAVQLAVRSGAGVIGLASERNHDWLRRHGAVPVQYGEGQADRIREVAPDGVQALADSFGGGYADLGIELGVPPGRISTIIDFEAVERLGIVGTGSHSVGNAEILAELANLVADGDLEVPIARAYPLEDVRDAVRELAERHTRGKIVLVM